MIDLHDVSKVYQIGEERVHALDHVTLHIFPKEFVSVIGPSGSGKSTLMNIIGCLDVADAGTYRLDGIPIEDYSEKQLARVRNQHRSPPHNGRALRLSGCPPSCGCGQARRAHSLLAYPAGCRLPAPQMLLPGAQARRPCRPGSFCRRSAAR